MVNGKLKTYRLHIIKVLDKIYCVVYKACNVLNDNAIDNTGLLYGHPEYYQQFHLNYIWWASRVGVSQNIPYPFIINISKLIYRLPAILECLQRCGFQS